MAKDLIIKGSEVEEHFVKNPTHRFYILTAWGLRELRADGVQGVLVWKLDCGDRGWLRHNPADTPQVRVLVP